jgi:peroxiredoxin
MKHIIYSILLFSSFLLNGQVLQGRFTEHPDKQFSLYGFKYDQQYKLAETTSDSLGNFVLHYPKTYKGVAVIAASKNEQLLILLEEPAMQLYGTHIKALDSVSYKSPINQLFNTIGKGYTMRNNVYRAWRFLLKNYESTSLKTQHVELKAIKKAIQKIEVVNKKQLQLAPDNSYLQWYLPQRKLLNDMPQTLYNYPERLDRDLSTFRNIDFSHPNFKTSGLFWPLIEKHYFLLENMGQSLDSVYAQMNSSTDILLNSLKKKNDLYNTTAEKLFQLFEKRSLFKAAAHLSTRLLNTNDCACTLKEKLQRKLQKYGALKVGNTAPDINLGATKLSDLNKTVLLVFGNSECPHCTKDISKLKAYYTAWKQKKDLEIVYISTDTQKHKYQTAYAKLPWQLYCDFKGWDTQAVKDYYVNATPTYLLLDKERTILAHPRSVEHVNTLVNYTL